MVKPSRPRKGSIIQADKGIDYSGGHADVRVFNVAYRGDGIAVSGRANAALHVRYDTKFHTASSLFVLHSIWCVLHCRFFVSHSSGHFDDPTDILAFHCRCAVVVMPRMAAVQPCKVQQCVCC